MRYLKAARQRLKESIRNLRLSLSKPQPYGKEKIIWVKTPKCGGTSIKNRLEDLGYLRMMKPGKALITGVYSGQIDKFRDRYPEFWDQAWKFAIVRNPYDKFVSGWKYLRATKDLSLKEVLTNPPGKKPRYHDWMHLTCTQTEPLSDKKGNFAIDKVVHFENLDAELNEVMRHLGLQDVELPVENPTKGRKKSFMDYFDNETLELLNRRYENDFTVLDYQKVLSK